MDWENIPLFPTDLFDEEQGWQRDPDVAFEALVLPLQGTVVFPGIITPLYVQEDESLAAVEAALEIDIPLITVARRPSDDSLGDALYDVGTEIQITQSIRLPDGTISLIVQALDAVRIQEYLTPDRLYQTVRAMPINEPEQKGALVEALKRAVLGLFQKVVMLDDNLPEESYIYAMNAKRPSTLANFIASLLNLNVAQQQELLEIPSTIQRLQKINAHLAQELDVLELESQIQASVQEEVDRAQRQYFLREQLRAIQHELGETDILARDVIRLQEMVEQTPLPPAVDQRAREEIDRLSMLSAAAPEVGIIRTYLDWLLKLPWTETTEDNLDLAHAQDVLDANHYGLSKAKTRILEYIAVRRLAPETAHGTILCFVGPPGTGKTSLGQSIAKALGRTFVRLSLGGIRDEAEIRGHRRTYVGALPGRIIQTMRRAGTLNPVFMLDEIDKLGRDFRGDPSAALLEILDPEQNHAFSDHYLELPYDLSQVFFITTANVLYTLPSALEDRLEIIEFPGYTEYEKIKIAQRFLVPRQIEHNGLQEEPPHFPKATLQRLIRDYTYEAGVRNLERQISSLCRKATRRLAEDKRPIAKFTAASLTKYLGAPEYPPEQLEQQDAIGVAMGMAWTAEGGVLLPVEVALMPGKGNLTLTGQLGDVMQESAQAALTYLRSQADTWNIDPESFENVDIHIHLPEGAIPKDGPSGGITIATALFSAFLKRPVRRSVALSGEITLRGRVLPVGGLKEKLLAAHRVGAKTAILPQRNQPNLEEIAKKIREDLEIQLVRDMDEVLEIALVPEAG